MVTMARSVSSATSLPRRRLDAEVGLALFPLAKQLIKPLASVGMTPPVASATRSCIMLDRTEAFIERMVRSE